MQPGTEKRQAPPISGMFDKRDKETVAVPIQSDAKPVAKKEEFKGVFEQHAETVKDRIGKPAKLPDEAEASVEKAAAALNNNEVKKLEAEFDDLEKISDKDLELAEQMIFKGYAETNVIIPNLPKHEFTIISTSAEEMGIIDEIIFEMVKKSENTEGVVDLPSSKVQAMRNSLFLAMSYRGVDKKELMEENTTAHLNTLKRSIIKISDLENAGDLEKSVELKNTVKKYLKLRASKIGRLATPIIDFLSGEKYNFDARMLKIMSSKHILPKS